MVRSIDEILAPKPEGLNAMCGKCKGTKVIIRKGGNVDACPHCTKVTEFEYQRLRDGSISGEEKKDAGNDGKT